MLLSDLFSDLITENLPNIGMLDVTSLACHTRDIRKGSLWFCIQGTQFDPTPLLSTAARKGATAAVVERGLSPSPSIGIPIIEVDDIRKCVAHIYYKFYRLPNKKIRFHAVTGTNGKTSTAVMLSHILSEGGIRCGFIGSIGCLLNGLPFPGNTGTMTTPPPEELYPILAAMESAGATDIVIEVSSHAIAQKRIAPLHFENAIFTNLSEEHLDYHKTFENYLLTKAKLFDEATNAYFLSDEPHSTLVCGKAQNLFGCGGEKDSFSVNHIVTDISGSSFTLKAEGTSVRMFLPVCGEFMAINALLALRAALKCGVSLAKAIHALGNFHGVTGRMERIPLPSHITDLEVIIDYAHTPKALQSLLLSVRKLTSGRVVLLFGCGGNRDREKRAAMGKIAEELSDFVYVTSDNPRMESPTQIIKDILSGMTRQNARVIASRRRAITVALSERMPNDILILAGKGHEGYEIIGRTLFPFCEREIVNSELSKSKNGNTNTTLGE